LQSKIADEDVTSKRSQRLKQISRTEHKMEYQHGLIITSHNF